MKQILFISLIILSIGCEDKTTVGGKSKDDTTTKNMLAYSKQDLTKIKWIEGSWKGLDGQKPFYEIYHFTNDSTLSIITYDWNGRDSSNSDLDSLQWKTDGYYLGKDQNWKVVTTTSSQIKMMPMKASNDITWQTVDNNSWDATLVNRKGTTIYHMERFDPFKK